MYSLLLCTMKFKRSTSVQHYFLKRLKHYFEIGDFKSIILLLDYEVIRVAGTDVWYYLLLMIRANSSKLILQPMARYSSDIRFFICLSSEKILVKLTLNQKQSVSAITIFVNESQMRYINLKLIGNQLIESGILYVPPGNIQLKTNKMSLLRRNR